MRSYLRKQCLERFALALEAKVQFFALLEAGETEAAGMLLVGCQQTVMDLGDLLEKEEQTEEIVRKLTQVCEEIYETHTALFGDAENHREANPSEAGGHFSCGQDLLREAWEMFLQNVPEEKEVVFFPYNSSMWDCLASFWKEKKAEPGTKVYVVPIPYYERTPDGGLGQIHYEGDHFPPEVEITPLAQYDPALRHPDEIYIHNPYDGNNLVTSVAPAFYSDQLKKYTDRLIYVPYFVLGEPQEDDPAVYETEEFFERMRHFCVLPGVLHADCVILPSEKMKQIYIDTLDHWLNPDLTPGFKEALDRKFLVHHSTKEEHYKRLAKEGVEVPEAWKSLLLDEDGQLRKSIFYNTSVLSMLNGAQKMLQKIRDTLAIFYEERNNVVLIWRPHPLMENTLRALSPELLEEYRDIVEGYRAGGWGIYDDLPNADAAMILSTAYYGDNSSLVQLYHSLDKPVMVQNIDVLNHD